MRHKVALYHACGLTACLLSVSILSVAPAESSPEARWRLTEGNEFAIEAEVSQTGADGKTRVMRRARYVFELKVTRADEAGSGDAEMRIVSIKAGTLADGRNVEFDSNAPQDESSSKNPLFYLAGLVGKSFRLAITPAGAGDVLPALDSLGLQQTAFLFDLLEVLEFTFNFASATEGSHDKTWTKFVTVPLSATFSQLANTMEERKCELGRTAKREGQEIVNLSFTSTLCKPATQEQLIDSMGVESGQGNTGVPKDKKEKPPAPPQGKGTGTYQISTEGWVVSGEMQRNVSAAVEKKTLKLETKLAVKVTKQEKGTE